MIRALAALALLTATAAAAPGGVVRVEHRDPASPPSRGPQNALVTIELFFAPNSNAGARLPIYRALEQLQAQHPTRIRLVYRVMRSTQSRLAPAALEAHAEGKFFAFMDELNARTRQIGNDELAEIAKQAGVDPARVALAADEGWYAAATEANDRRFVRLRVGGNQPGLLLNGVPLKGSFSQLAADQLAAAYRDAYDRALEKLERGVAPEDLAAAFDDDALAAAQPNVTSSSVDAAPGGEHPLASPPLALGGLPSYGAADAPGALTVVILCSPKDARCQSTMSVTATMAAARYGDQVRVVWAPWFDVLADNAADLSMLADAALCAEQIGSGDEADRSKSAGWAWVKAMYAQIKTGGSKLSAEALIDATAARRDVDLDRRALAACRARMADTALSWIAAARRSGVARVPAIVIGGRIYEGLADDKLMGQLVDAELAPGVLGTVAPGRRGAPH